MTVMKVLSFKQDKVKVYWHLKEDLTFTRDDMPFLPIEFNDIDLKTWQKIIDPAFFCVVKDDN
jgi:hypothetical protein